MKEICVFKSKQNQKKTGCCYAPLYSYNLCKDSAALPDVRTEPQCDIKG